jgi:hypothetical protein
MAITTSDPDNDPATPRPSLKFGTSSDAGNQSLRKEFPAENAMAALSEYYRGAGIVPDVLVIPGTTGTPNEYGSDTLIEFGHIGPGELGFGESPVNLFYAWKVNAAGAAIYSSLYNWSAGDILFAWGAPNSGIGIINYTFKVANGQIGTGYEHTDGFTYTTGQSASSQPITQYYGDAGVGNEGGQGGGGSGSVALAWFYNLYFERYYIRRKETEVDTPASTVDLNQIVPKSGPISFSQLYGAANIYAFTISTNTQEADIRALAVTAGWDENSNLRVVINSGVYVWSNNINTPALKIDGSFPSSVIIENYGYIIGRGGNGSAGNNNDAQAGGSAIKISITESNRFAHIVNKSGAYIAGGGGGGGAMYSGGDGTSNNKNRVYGGGGAGGGVGAGAGGAGGAVGATGADGTSSSSRSEAHGGGSGGGSGGGAGGQMVRNSGTTTSGAGGGGRILPGVGGTKSLNFGGNGGSGGNAGSNGGGGGWGASGGSAAGIIYQNNGGYRIAPGAGGAAIESVSGSRSLQNNGTIYGEI